MTGNFTNRNKQSANFKKILNNINENLRINDLNSAVKNILKALEIEPENHLLLNELGTCHAKLEEYELALHYHNKAASIDNTNAIILTNVGVDLLHLDRLPEAIQFFQFAIEEDDKYYPAYNGISTAYHDLGDINNLYQISIRCITIFPERCDFHLNLGIALIYLDKLQEALYCFDTALILMPNLFSAQINQAVAYGKLGNYSMAIKLYEDIISRTDLQNESVLNAVKFNLSFQYLNQGNLVKGWEYYDFGFEKSIPYNQRRKPNRKFNSPTWNGEFSSHKTLMIWREQGLGDELLFLSMVPDLINNFKLLIIECELRLIDAIKATYPQAVVRESISLDVEDYDYQIPMGSLCKYLRNEIKDFGERTPWLKPPKVQDNLFNDLFEYNSDKLLIGICWRSGLLNHQRNNNYIPLNEWDEIFKIPNAIFVNLQYGECENELIEAEKKFNIKIARWSHIDLKNNLSLVFNLIDSLDFVVSAATAVSAMAYSIGKTTLVFQPRSNWTNLGEHYSPWSRDMHQFMPKDNQGIASTLVDISQHIMSSKKHA
jgi:tetratricopeptide (TPR) repeat protein